MAKLHYRLMIKDRTPEYTAGHRHGIRACVAWLHRRAKEMNDPAAEMILNTAAFSLGTEAAHAREGCRCYYLREPQRDCNIHSFLVFTPKETDQ